MSEAKQLTDNEVIAVFMGGVLNKGKKIYRFPVEFGWKCELEEYSGPSNMWPIDELQYDTSWDWLMPVVEKIEDVISIGQRCYITISPYKISGYCSGVLDKGLSLFYIKFEGEDLRGKKKLETVYKVVIEFIRWYNSHPDKP